MTVILLGMVATAIAALAAQRRIVLASQPSRDVRFAHRSDALDS